ncbi:MAG: RNA methyltransferase [Acidimicrobiia bacterium]|nr:RNA methyltransferase [Acidimicrobiia bacterium]
MAPSGAGAEVEGLHAVAAAVAAGRVERLFVEAGRAEALRRLRDEAAAAGAEVQVVPDLGRLAATTAPQGVVAHCRPLRTFDLVAVAGRQSPAALVVLDHLEDPRNVGAVARSALAAGMTGLVLARRRSAPLGATAFKAAAGALERLPVALVSSVAQAVADLGRLGVWTVGLDAEATRSLFGLQLLAEPVAVVVGAEGRGLAPLVADRVDARVFIPLGGGVESLNAAVAVSLACYEVARVRVGSREGAAG